MAEELLAAEQLVVRVLDPALGWLPWRPYPRAPIRGDLLDVVGTVADAGSRRRPSRRNGRRIREAACQLDLMGTAPRAWPNRDGLTRGSRPDGSLMLAATPTGGKCSRAVLMEPGYQYPRRSPLSG